MVAAALTLLTAAWVANHVWWHITEASFSLILVAVITVFGARWTRRVERKVEKTVEQTDTGNEKNLGTYVHDMAQTQELLSAQLHTNTREVVMAAEKAEEVKAQLERRVEIEDERSERIETKLDQHIEATKNRFELMAYELGVVRRAISPIEENEKGEGAA